MLGSVLPNGKNYLRYLLVTIVIVIVVGLFFLIKFYPPEVSFKFEPGILDDKNQPSLEEFYRSSPSMATQLMPLDSSSPLNFVRPTNQDVLVGLQYDEPNSQRGWSYSQSSLGIYTDPPSGEQYLLLSKSLDTQYGDREYSIFQAKESHSYQGTPVYLSTTQNNQALAYVGLKLNNQSLVRSMRVELGVDYAAQPGKQGFLGGLINKIFSWLGPKRVEACGPGIYLRKVGSSNLTFVGLKDGVSWFKLDKEISVNNIPLEYCNNGADCGGYNAKVKDLSNGNLRMHLDYVPTGQEGVLKVQLASAVFRNELSNTLTDATLNTDLADMYRAILSDREDGALKLVFNENNPTKINLSLENKGNTPITINQYSFNRIRNSYPDKQAIGFVVRDSRNRAVAHISLSTILIQTEGKIIRPDQSLLIPFFSASPFHDDVYGISVEYASTTARAPIAPWLINWDFKEGNSLFYANDRPIYIFVVGRGGGEYGLIRLYSSPMYLSDTKGSIYPYYSLNYSFPSPADYPQISERLNPASAIQQTSVSHLQNNNGLVYSYYVPVSATELIDQLGARSTGTLTDFEGNTIFVYTRNSLTGYVLERDVSNKDHNLVHATIVYEIPTSYLSDSIFKQIYEFTIRSASFYQYN